MAGQGTRTRPRPMTGRKDGRTVGRGIVRGRGRGREAHRSQPQQQVDGATETDGQAAVKNAGRGPFVALASGYFSLALPQESREHGDTGPWSGGWPRWRGGRCRGPLRGRERDGGGTYLTRPSLVGSPFGRTQEGFDSQTRAEQAPGDGEQVQCRCTYAVACI